MIYHILLTCSLTVVLVSGQRYPKSIQAQPRVGYSTSIVHPYPGYNNLQAESSVDVHFQPQQTLVDQNSQGATKYIQTTSNTPRGHLFTRNSFSGNPKSSNSFNVGYNLSFNENAYNTRIKEPRYTQVNSKKFDNAEVITGKVKKNEKVRAPTINMDLSPHEFVSNAFMKQNHFRYTSSPPPITKVTNTNYVAPVREQSSKYPSQSPIFTFNTQQNNFKDVVKAAKHQPLQLNSEFKTSYETSDRWKDINPGADSNGILESNDSENSYLYFGKLRGSKHTNVAAQIPSNFNHDVAIKNSEAFDFSNAHGEINIGGTKRSLDSIPEGSEQYGHRVNSYDVHKHSNSNNDADSNSNLHQASDLNNLNIEAHIPKNLRGVKPLPLDTSLLKDPILTTTFKVPSNDARVIPIHFDIRQIQTAMQKELGGLQNLASHQNPYGPQQARNSGYAAQQNYGQQLEPTNGRGSAYEDHDSSPSQKNLMIYAQPEPFDQNQYKAGFTYGKEERANYEDDIYKIVSMRPPPIVQNLRY